MESETEILSNSSSSSSPSSSFSSFQGNNVNHETSHKRRGGRKKFKETRHPVYRGVRQRNGNKWVCEIREPNKKSRIWLGTHRTPEMAAMAHDVAALALRGTMAALNFPESASRIPQLPQSASAKEIRKAAQEAAQLAFDQPICSDETERRSVREKEVPSEPNCCSVDNEMMMMTTTTSFLDEEALFNMPGLVDSMAEGLLLTPPAMERGFSWDDVTCDFDHFNLWSH